MERVIDVDGSLRPVACREGGLYYTVNNSERFSEQMARLANVLTHLHVGIRLLNKLGHDIFPESPLGAETVEDLLSRSAL